jgi:hypothetical protein
MTALESHSCCSIFETHNKYVYILFAALYNGVVTRVRNGCRIPDQKKILSKEQTLAKPNFDFQKRQKEIAKKKKNEEKKQRKLEKNSAASAEKPVPATEEEESK